LQYLDIPHDLSFRSIITLCCYNQAMSKRLKILSLAALVILIGVGVFVYFNMKEYQQHAAVPQTAVATAPTNPDTVTKLSPLVGTFFGRDVVHRASGTVSTMETADGPMVQFKDFSVTPGPDLFVYLSPNAPGEELGTYVSLGHIKSFSGEQTYNLPENYRDYKTIVIWCRSFSVTFATAELVPEES
jgi:hypothetical protein